MTGLYSSHHHVGHTSQKVIRTKRIDPEFTTLAELAHDSGYITAGITDGGFVSNFYGFQQGFQQYIENTAKGSMESIRTIENALSWLKQKQQRPFFLFLHTYRVHEPFSPSVDSFKSLFPDWPVKDSRDLKVPMDWLSKVVNGKIIPTEKEKEFVRHCYDAEVHFFDRQFGRFMNELKRMKLDQDTVILIFGDHGEQLFDRGNGFGHGKTLLPEEIRVPLILYVPGKDHQDKIDLASLVDIYPTLAQLMGSKFQHSIDGMSLLEPSESKRRNNRVVYYEVNYGTEALWGIQSRHEKLVFDSQRKMEVYYDLTKDPFENGKLTAANRGVPKLMKQLLGSYISQSLAAQSDTNTGDLKENRELEEELRALGYIN